MSVSRFARSAAACAGLAALAVLALTCLPRMTESGRPLPRHRNAEEAGRVVEAWEAAGRPKTFRFAVLGDNRDGEATHRALIGQINADPGLLFVVNTGDLVANGSAGGFVDFVRDIGRCRIPYLVVPGNHDSRGGGKERFLEVFGPRDWTFDLGGNRFVGLDNAGYEFTDRQLDWLDEALAGPRRAFVFVHIPPPLGKWEAHSFGRNADRFLEIVRRRRPARVFCGHIHGYGRQEAEGTVFVVTGGAGAPQEGVHGRAGVETVFHYVRVEADEESVREEKVELGR